MGVVGASTTSIGVQLRYRLIAIVDFRYAR